MLTKTNWIAVVIAISSLCFLGTVNAHNKVVVISMGGDDINQCQITTACEAGQATVSCPSGDEQVSCTVPKRVFLTSTTHNGNLGGLEGADAICQGLANRQGLNGVFKAWLSDSTGSPSTRFTKSAAPYVSVHGGVIANNYDDLTDSNLNFPICVDEKGSLAKCFSFNPVWTATTTIGTWDSSPAVSCTNWTFDVAAEEGKVGDASKQTASWTKLTITNTCNGKSHLYCIEQ